MPLISAEEITKAVVGDDRLVHHLRQAESHRSQMSFRQHCARFGIHDLGELNDRQLLALVAARNVAPAIDLLRIPQGREITGEGKAKSYDLRRAKTSLGPAINAVLGSVPQRELEWEILRDPEDIPEAIPEDLLLRRLAPKEFLRRLAEGELLREAWVQDEASLEENIQAPAEVEQSGAVAPANNDQDILPFGYLLLDASESMGTRRDHRDVVARGLALAFLVSQHEAGNPTYVNLFRHELSPTYGGKGRQAFESAVAAVLGHPAEGMTYLQGALRLLAEAKAERTARVDIALITDGISRLTENPLEGSHLHSFVLAADSEEFDKHGAAQYKEASHVLQTWSDFFLRFDTEIMKKATVPLRSDLVDVVIAFQGLESSLFESVSVDKVQRLQQRVQNIALLFTSYRDYHGKTDPEIERLWAEVERELGKIGKSDAAAIARTNAAKWAPIDRDLHLALETREMKGLLREEPFRLTMGSVPEARMVGLNEVMFRLLRMVRSFLRRVFRRIRVQA